MKRLLLEHLRKPYGVLIRPAGMVCLLLAMLWTVNSLGLQSAEQRRAQLSAQWAQARKEHQQHQAARRAKQDLAQVWASLPEELAALREVKKAVPGMPVTVRLSAPTADGR